MSTSYLPRKEMIERLIAIHNDCREKKTRAAIRGLLKEAKPSYHDSTRLAVLHDPIYRAAKQSPGITLAELAALVASPEEDIKDDRTRNRLKSIIRTAVDSHGLLELRKRQDRINMFKRIPWGVYLKGSPMPEDHSTPQTPRSPTEHKFFKYLEPEGIPIGELSRKARLKHATVRRCAKKHGCPVRKERVRGMELLVVYPSKSPPTAAQRSAPQQPSTSTPDSTVILKKLMGNHPRGIALTRATQHLNLSPADTVELARLTGFRVVKRRRTNDTTGDSERVILVEHLEP